VSGWVCVNYWRGGRYGGGAALWPALHPSIIAPRSRVATRLAPREPPRPAAVPPKRLPSADPLEGSKMSFGEHLDELRAALFKAVIAIFLGFLVGLLVGGRFIRYVNAPLERGLSQVERDRKLEDYDQENGEPAEEAEGAARGDGGALREEGLAPERYYVDPAALVELLEGLGVSVEAPEALPDRAPLWLWSQPRDAQIIATATQDGFAIYIKASLVVGTVLASPAVFYFLWSFVAAGLYPHEKRYVHLFLPISIGLFLLGATVAFYLVLQYVIGFLLSFNAWLGIDSTPRINEWLSFVLILPVGFGISFQLPLVMLFLERIGVFSTEQYVRYWRYAVLVIFILSMVLSPPDPQSQLFMAIPLCGLYLGGVLLCKLMPVGKKSFSERLADDPEP